jgi:hypothetical protein
MRVVPQLCPPLPVCLSRTVMLAAFVSMVAFSSVRPSVELAMGRVGLASGVAVKEVTLFKIEPKITDLSTMAISHDRTHYAFVTRDAKTAVVDGKKYGGYVRIGAVTFAGNSNDWAFVGIKKEGGKGFLVLNGEEQNLPDSVVRIIRAGSKGGLAWVEQTLTGASFRLAFGTQTSEWCDLIERVNFAEDGATYLMYCRDRQMVKQKQADGTDKMVSTGMLDYYLMNGKDRVESQKRVLFAVAPKTGRQLSVYDDGDQADQGRNRVVAHNQTGRFPGQLVGQAFFSSTGKSSVLRCEYTGVTAEGNRQFSSYVVNALTHKELYYQAGLTFFPNSDQYVFCGFRDKVAYLYRSDTGARKYAEVPAMQGAPNDLYRACAFADNKLILLFQTKRATPQLFLEDRGMVDVGVTYIAPNSLSVSPDGKWLAFGAEKDGLTNCFVLNVQNPTEFQMVGKADYQMDNPDANRPQWTSNRTFHFMALRSAKVIRMEVSL